MAALLVHAACTVGVESAAFRDDVTNGLTAERRLADAPAESAESTEVLAGAFFNDGGVGDLRGTAPAQERLVVYTGNLRLDVPRPEESVARLVARTAELGGHLSQQTDATVTVRVPSKHFDTLFAELRGYGRVLAESRQANDVTAEFTDLGIRLENARKGRERLLALLERAEKMEDILKIEEQLRRLSEEIERIEGQKRLLADQIAMATLTAQFRATAAQAPTTKRRGPSRFPWVNAMGPEIMRREF
jgi:hypothetical protein